MVVHWVGCVCNQSWHVHACLSNSWHKLQVAAFAQLAVVGRRSNTCVYVIAIFTMCESTEQRICIKFCFKNWKTCNGNVSVIAVSIWWRCTGSYTSVWFCRFKEERTSIESDPRSGQPSTLRNEATIAKVRTIIRNNRRLTVRETADISGISVGSCNAILTDDRTWNVCASPDTFWTNLVILPLCYKCLQYSVQ